MLKPLLSLLFVLTAFLSNGQNIEIIALGKPQPTHRGLMVAQELLQLSAEDGTPQRITDLGLLPPPIARTAALNPITDAFIFWAKNDQTNAYQLHTLDATTGKPLRPVVDFATPPLDVHFDLRLQRFFGLRPSASKDGLEVIQINPDQKTEVLLDVPGVSSLSIGVTAYDSNRSFYIFAATNAQYQSLLYVLDLSNRKILYTARIADYYFYELQYDVQDSKLYGLCRKKTNTEQFFFVEIDFTQARPILIAPVLDLANLQTGVSAFEQKEGLYFFVGTNVRNEKRLYTIDALSGDVVYSPILDKNIEAIACNNRSFVQSYYQNVIPEEQYPALIQTSGGGDKTNQTSLSLVLSPLAVVDLLNIEVNLEQGTPFQVWVIDMVGKTVQQEKFFKSEHAEDNSINLANLPAGIYRIEVRTDKDTISQKIIKR